MATNLWELTKKTTLEFSPTHSTVVLEGEI